MTSRSNSPSPSEIGPSRIRLARERRGLSQVALAKELGLSARLVRAYESDGAPAGRAGRLSEVLDTPVEFFAPADLEELTSEQCFFRAGRRSSEREQASARAAGVLGVELYGWIGRRFALPVVDLPGLDHRTAENAATALRSAWGLGDAPLPNLVHLGEAHGVRILSLPNEARRVEAGSFWRHDAPYVFLSATRPAERARFDLAHELGHLVMHSRGTPGVDREREADEFAAAFLMPRLALLAHAGRQPAVPHILQMRDHYKVPAAVLTQRLHELGATNADVFRQNCIGLRFRHLFDEVPEGLARQRSRIFDVAGPLMREDQGRDVREEIGLSLHDVHDLTFGQVPLGIAGQQQPRSGERPELRVVEA